MEPLISVIIPIYNMEVYLARCLDSVLANTYKNLELLCVDDGSEDSSLKILRDYAAKDPRIVVIAKGNGGVSSARNAALDRITGEFITFVDPDDFVHPRYFELLQRAQAETNADFVVCSFRTVEDKDLPVSMEDISFRSESLQLLGCPEIFMDHSLRGNCWGRLIRADCLKGLHFRQSINYSEDTVFIAELWEGLPDMRAALLSENLYYYYQREGSLVKEAKTAERYQVATLFMEKLQCAKDNEVIYLDQALKRSLSTWYLTSHILVDKELARASKRLLKPCAKRMRQSSLYSRKQKLLYSVFCLFPQTYWLYRSITEPDMWAWEKVEWKKRRIEKREEL